MLVKITFEKVELNNKLSKIERKYKVLEGLNEHNETLLSKWMTPRDEKSGKFVKK